MTLISTLDRIGVETKVRMSSPDGSSRVSGLTPLSPYAKDNTTKLLWHRMLAWWRCITQNYLNVQYLTQYHTQFPTMYGSDKLPWGVAYVLCVTNRRATSSLGHPVTSWTLTGLTCGGHPRIFHWPWWLAMWPEIVDWACSGFAHQI